MHHCQRRHHLHRLQLLGLLLDQLGGGGVRVVALHLLRDELDRPEQVVEGVAHSPHVVAQVSLPLLVKLEVLRFVDVLRVATGESAVSQAGIVTRGKSLLLVHRSLLALEVVPLSFLLSTRLPR